MKNEHNNFKWVNKSDYSTVDDGSDYFDVLRKYFKLEHGNGKGLLN